METATSEDTTIIAYDQFGPCLADILVGGVLDDRLYQY